MESSKYVLLTHDTLSKIGSQIGVSPNISSLISQVWDQRKPEKVREIAENDEYISAFVVNSDRNTLLATSGDGTLTIIDYASGKAIDRSEEQDDELLSLALIKNGRKIVCGGQSGLLSIFTWDQWGTFCGPSIAKISDKIC